MTAFICTGMGYIALLLSVLAFGYAVNGSEDWPKASKDLEWSWKYSIAAALFFLVAK